MARALVDTGAVVALVNRADRQHAAAVDWFQRFRGQLLTTEAVVTETAYVLAASPAHQRAALLWFERARAAAEAAGVEVQWRRHGLEELPEEAAYDLVSAFYPALLRGDGSVVDVLLDAVAEGGTLLVVHHAHVDRDRAREHGFDPDDYVRHEDVLGALSSTDWVIEKAGEAGRTPPAGPGAEHHTDLVLRAWRKISA